MEYFDGCDTMTETLMKKQKYDLPSWVRQAAADWSALWGAPGLESLVTLEISRRMTRTLGRCYLERRLIRLPERLLQAPQTLIKEALCHELAHIAVHELNGKGCRPHGSEWAALMRAAGFEPRARLPEVPGQLPAPVRRPRRRYIYIHRCPVCQGERVARRAVRRWRCAECSAAGLDGRLEIWRRPAGGVRAP